MDTRRISAGGLDFAVLEAGAGNTNKLLLVHGFTGAKEDFSDHIDALAARGWHVVAPDHRGHGESDKPSGVESYSFDTMAADMVALADALDWPTFVVLGHSMGGMVAQRMGTDYQDRLRALVLMDTSPACPDGLDGSTLELAKGIIRDGGLAMLVQIQREQGLDLLATPAHQRMCDTLPGYKESGENKTLACSDDMWLAIVDEILNQEDRCAALSVVKVPTLVIVGEQDTPFLAHSERMTKTIGGARMAVIADAGHSPQFEAPEPWFGALAGFLDEVRA